jgi:molecular chaperone DnaK
MDIVYGIDLGTTFSEIAYLQDGKPVVVTCENGKKCLPSVVGITPLGDIVTGYTALNQYAAFPENTVVSIKRKMGSGEKVSMGGGAYTPAEISAEILKALKKYAESETGIPVEKAVITVPAYFTDLQRKDTIAAGELAGIEVVRIINEPTAAALAYGCREDEAEKLLVYDLGGGTFDVSLILVEDGVLEVLATDGNSRLGGDDFDRRLEEHLLSRLPEDAVSAEDLQACVRIKNAAEAAKIKLSTKTTTKVKEGFLTSFKGKPVNLDCTVTRSEFEELIGPDLDQTFELAGKVINEAGIEAGEISKVLLVGGSTSIPKVYNSLHDLYPSKVHRELDPTYCVAMGAAIQAGIITGEEIDTILIDVNSHSLGIACMDIKPSGEPDYNYYSIIIHKNTAIPASMERTYYTSMENQKAVAIEVFQGENPDSRENTFLGSFLMDDLPKKLPVHSEIDVTFSYNINGIVEVTAVERKSGKTKNIQVDINAPAPETADIGIE